MRIIINQQNPKNKLEGIMDGYIGEIKMFAGTFAPLNWVFCWGQQLPISSYNALYSIIGTQFGGDGTTNFGVPDLRGRIPIGGGSGPNLTPRTPGQSGGAEIVTLTTSQLPSHSHTVKCDITTSGTQLKPSPKDALPATLGSGGYAVDETGNPIMKSDILNPSGNSQPHDNMPPWGCLNYIMCVEGIYPPRE
jgi:microcystin-dependent protein